MVVVRLHRRAASLGYLAEAAREASARADGVDVVLRHRELENVCLMKAMVLAAGLGTRLRPLTTIVPRRWSRSADDAAGDHPRSSAQLRRPRVIVNAHHFADMVIDICARDDNSACASKFRARSSARHRRRTEESCSFLLGAAPDRAVPRAQCRCHQHHRSAADGRTPSSRRALATLAVQHRERFTAVALRW